MGESEHDRRQVEDAYQTRHLELPAFDVVGFTKIVQSGGEQFEAVRSDNRWAVLRDMAGTNGMIYGVASHDRQCSKGYYRYTVGVKANRANGEYSHGGDEKEPFSIHIAQSEWVVFTLADFGSQYGGFWNDNPYRLVEKLGYSFNRTVGLHIDAFRPSFGSDHNSMEFMMPVVCCV